MIFESQDEMNIFPSDSFHLFSMHVKKQTLREIYAGGGKYASFREKKEGKN